jgi:hypothetical protein
VELFLQHMSYLFAHLSIVSPALILVVNATLVVRERVYVEQFPPPIVVCYAGEQLSAQGYSCSYKTGWVS